MLPCGQIIILQENRVVQCKNKQIKGICPDVAAGPAVLSAARCILEDVLHLTDGGGRIIGLSELAAFGPAV